MTEWWRIKTRGCHLSFFCNTRRKDEFTWERFSNTKVDKRVLYYICVPFRTEISHPYAYHFKNSSRSRSHKSGLDYTKIVIINKSEYIDNKDAVVDRDEFVETISNIRRIRREALEFVEDYVAHMQNVKCLQVQEFNRRYQYSPLKYFHKELGIWIKSQSMIEYIRMWSDNHALYFCEEKGKWT